MLKDPIRCSLDVAMIPADDSKTIDGLNMTLRDIVERIHEDVVDAL